MKITMWVRCTLHTDNAAFTFLNSSKFVRVLIDHQLFPLFSVDFPVFLCSRFPKWRFLSRSCSAHSPKQLGICSKFSLLSLQRIKMDSTENLASFIRIPRTSPGHPRPLLLVPLHVYCGLSIGEAQQKVAERTRPPVPRVFDLCVQHLSFSVSGSVRYQLVE